MIDKNDARAVSVVSSAELASMICCERVSVFISIPPWDIVLTLA